MKERNTSFHREELEKLTAPELEKLLLAELDSGSTNRDTVLQILSILENRDSKHQADCQIGTETALEKYLEGRDSVVFNRPSVHRRPKKWIGAVAATVLIVLTLLMTVPQTVGAESIFNIIGRWTQSLFGFSQSSSSAPADEYVFQSDDPALQKIFEAVAELGITQPVVPTWIPDQYVLTELIVNQQRVSTKVIAQMNSEGKYIVFTFELYGDSTSNKYPKDDISAEIYDTSGIKHYMILNEGKWTSVWNNENTECTITTNDSKEALYDMIDSIYWRLIK